MWCKMIIHHPRILPTTILTDAVMRPRPISIFSIADAMLPASLKRDIPEDLSVIVSEHGNFELPTDEYLKRSGLLG
jgi:hypothetical protein